MALPSKFYYDNLMQLLSNDTNYAVSVFYFDNVVDGENLKFIANKADRSMFTVLGYKDVLKHRYFTITSCTHLAPLVGGYVTTISTSDPLIIRLSKR